MSTMLAVLPVVWEETADRCLRSMLASDSSLGLTPDEILVVDNTRHGYCPYDEQLRNRIVGATLSGDEILAHERLHVYRDPEGHNLGVAESWNVAARRVLMNRLDWLVIVSTSMLFGPELHTTFRREVEAHEGAQIVECMGNSWHLIAIARSTLETVGLFDPWYYPAYEEAIDWGYRQKLLGLEDLGWPRVWCNAMSIGHAVHVDRARWDAPSGNGRALLDYYERKWGGPKGAEQYRAPFGDPTLPLDWCEPGFNVPEAARRYELEVWW